jgi:hemolysin-activating ACP:hemolysin acyltransferase
MLDLLDDSRDTGLFCGEIIFLMAVSNNGVHFALKSALASIQALLPQEDRKAVGALVVLYPSLSFANSALLFAFNSRLPAQIRNGSTLFANGESRSVMICGWGTLFMQ